MLGQFEASLRRKTSKDGEGEEKAKKHSCCSGHAHGHGVRKERSVREVTRERRNCSLPPESSSDEGGGEAFYSYSSSFSYSYFMLTSFT